MNVTQAQTTSATPSRTAIFRPNGAPRTTSGGASRGVCTLAQAGMPQVPRIIPLIPATTIELTAEGHPTLFVQIPDATVKEAELSIWDENLNGIYQTTVSLPGQAGIVSFKVPHSAPPLEIGKRYKWSLAVICDADQRSRDVVVEGWIQRTQLGTDLTEQLAVADPLQRVQLYAQNSIWYETLATLAQMRRSHPDDTSIAAEWQQLLQSVGLKNVAQTPVVNCCQSQTEQPLNNRQQQSQKDNKLNGAVFF